MWKRLASWLGDFGGNNKRRRVNEQAPVSFDGISADCKVHILSFLSNEDMNSFAICSRACRHVRTNESLDQTRTATILVVCRKLTTHASFMKKLRERRHIFTGNRTRLKLVGLERISIMFFQYMHPNVDFQLDGVPILDCTMSTGGKIGPPFNPFVILDQVLPNLEAIDLNDLSGAAVHGLSGFAQSHPTLSQITWNGLTGISFCGHEFSHCHSLTHLSLNYAEFELPRGDDYLLMECRNLECLSIKGARQVGLPRDKWKQEPLPQEVLIKLARCHPSLRWLRSNLNDANAEMLKRERPEITFVWR